MLKADLTSLRQCQMHQTQAFVLADPYSLTEQIYPFSPRNLLKRFVAETPLSKPVHLKMNFTVNFQKTNTKDDQPSPFHTVDHGAIKSNWQNNLAFQNALDTILRGMGIPVT